VNRAKRVPGTRVQSLLDEANLTGQLFLRANDFRMVQDCRGFFAEGSRDGYLFSRDVAAQRRWTTETKAQPEEIGRHT
jgi:hypothetical protein